MKEVAGATALMLDASGMLSLHEFTAKEAYLQDVRRPCHITLPVFRLIMMVIKFGLCIALYSTPWPGFMPAGSIHSLFRENTVITGSYW